MAAVLPGSFLFYAIGSLVVFLHFLDFVSVSFSPPPSSDPRFSSPLLIKSLDLPLVSFRPPSRSAVPILLLPFCFDREPPSVKIRLAPLTQVFFSRRLFPPTMIIPPPLFQSLFTLPRVVSRSGSPKPPPLCQYPLRPPCSSLFVGKRPFPPILPSSITTLFFLFPERKMCFCSLVVSGSPHTPHG